MPSLKTCLRINLIAYLIFWLPIFALPQPDLYFDNLSVEDGLSDLKVMCILQDRKGVMWFGTEMGGLCRYDGQQIKVFNYDPDFPERNYPGRCVNAMFEDEAGHIWNIGGPPGGLHRFDPEREMIVEHYPIDGWSITTYLGSNGRIWVGHSQEGLLFLDRDSGIIKSFREEFAPDLPKDYVWYIAEDDFGNLWFTYPNGIYQWIAAENKLIYHPFREEMYRALDDKMFTELYVDSQQNLWAGTEKGLFFFDRQQKAFQPYIIPGSDLFFINAIEEDKDGYLWMGHQNGLFLLNPKNGAGRQYETTSGVKGTIQGVPQTIYRDCRGNMWLGHYNNGVDYWDWHRKRFTAYRHDPKVTNSIRWNTVTGLHEDSNGQIWVANGNLEQFDPKEEAFTQVFQFDVQYQVLDVITDRENKLWVGSWLNGLQVLHSAGHKLASFQANPADKSSLPGNAATLAYADLQGNIWVSIFHEGLFRYQPEQNNFLKYPLFHPETKAPIGTGIKTIHEDQHGNFWLGEHYHLIKLTPDYTVDKVYDISTHQIHEDTAGIFWIASLNGLYKLDPQTGQQQVWRQKDGLPVNDVHSILADDHGGLWLGTKLGLAHFDIQTETFTTYDPSDGLPGYQFTTGASLKAGNGEFYFGLREGLLRFHPDSIRPNPVIPSVMITDFRIQNVSVPIRGSEHDTLKNTSPLEKHIAYIDEIQLAWRQNDISFSFAALNYLNPEKNQYKYRLENYDEEWTFTSASNPTAVYTNLNPGKYTFRVTGSNNDGVWNEAGTSLSIIITPPWWATWWAYGIYGLLILGLLYGLRTYELKRKLAHFEAARLKDLDQAKSRLYTNITHEFRTPLSIILGVTGQVKKEVEARVTPHLEMIERNGRQLLQLVNQLLDLSKVDSGKFQLNYQQGDIVNYLKYLIESFHSLAEQKAIQLHFLSDKDSLMMDYDQERLQQIFYNLISNALKFTPEGGHIYFIVSNPEGAGSFSSPTKPQNRKMQNIKPQIQATFTFFISRFYILRLIYLACPRTKRELNSPAPKGLTIKIKDTGIGIPADQLSKIFDRFYQLDDSNTRRAEGTGIGLALVKELLKLMGGNITVKSKPGKGTEFIITLPIRRTAGLITTTELKQIPINGRMNALQPLPSTPVEGPKVLVIEDNRDVQFYIQNCLSTSYQVEMVFDGADGIEKAQKIIPDLIICDVMMPIKDGFEVCKTLKQDRRTSHIPIVMLTAKADFQSKLQGLQHGADIYLTKPFQEEELLLHLHNLLLQRARLQQHYLFLSGLNEHPAFEHTDEDSETDFVGQVKAKILEHLTDSTFTVSQLSREMTLSQSQLHRKLTALTGYSASKMIRMIRLNHAKTLLQNQALTIASVAYDSGFNDPDYMSKVFKQEFGITPSEFRMEQKVWDAEG